VAKLTYFIISKNNLAETGLTCQLRLALLALVYKGKHPLLLRRFYIHFIDIVS
jgi:hypothetical protein